MNEYHHLHRTMKREFDKQDATGWPSPELRQATYNVTQYLWTMAQANAADQQASKPHLRKLMDKLETERKKHRE